MQRKSATDLASLKRTLANQLASLEEFYVETNRIFGRKYRREDRVPFLAVYEVAMLRFDDDGRKPIHPDELVFFKDGSTHERWMTWGELQALPGERRRELAIDPGWMIVRKTHMSAIEALTPGLIRKWYEHPPVKKQIETRAKREGFSPGVLKRNAIQVALLLAEGDRMRCQDVRFGSQGKKQRDVVPGRDLGGVEFMRWFKKRTLAEAEAYIGVRKRRAKTKNRTARVEISITEFDAAGQIPDNSPSPEQQVVSLDLLARVARECPREMKEVHRLEVQGFSLQEIAERTELSISQVRTRLKKISAIEQRLLEAHQVQADPI